MLVGGWIEENVFVSVFKFFFFLFKIVSVICLSTIIGYYYRFFAKFVCRVLQVYRPYLMKHRWKEVIWPAIFWFDSKEWNTFCCIQSQLVKVYITRRIEIYWHFENMNKWINLWYDRMNDEWRYVYHLVESLRLIQFYSIFFITR